MYVCCSSDTNKKHTQSVAGVKGGRIYNELAFMIKSNLEDFIKRKIRLDL